MMRRIKGMTSLLLLFWIGMLLAGCGGPADGSYRQVYPPVTAAAEAAQTEPGSAPETEAVQTETEAAPEPASETEAAQTESEAASEPAPETENLSQTEALIPEIAAARAEESAETAAPSETPAPAPEDSTEAASPVQSSAPETEGRTAPAAPETESAAEPPQTDAGESSGAGESGGRASAQDEPGTTGPAEAQITYVLNRNTKKFHLPSCSSVGDIKPENREDFYGTKEEAEAMGYQACKRCKP